MTERSLTTVQQVVEETVYERDLETGVIVKETKTTTISGFVPTAEEEIFGNGQGL